MSSPAEATRRPLVSVCILAGHGGPSLRACLTSLRNQASAPPFELLVGGESSDLLSLVHDYFPAAHICTLGRQLPGAARNPLIERARGEFLLFLDDDVTAPVNLLRDLAEVAARHPEASVFGGPNETPPDSSMFQIVQGCVLGSLLGSGPVSRRYGARRACSADERWFTLCNLAVRRRTMAPFVDSLICAEENALLADLHSRGEIMRYDPRLRVFHARRARWRSFVRQMFKYGRGRGELLRRNPAATRLAYLPPPALLVYLLLLPGLLVLSSRNLLVLVPAGLYVALIAASALRIALTLRSVRSAPLAAALIASIHVWYGAGILRGLSRPGVAAEAELPRWVAPARGVPGVGQREAQAARPPLEYDSA